MGALTGALLGLTALQTASQFQSEKQQGRYQKSIADANARLLNLRSEDAIRRGYEDASLVRRRAERMAGSQRAAMAAQGIDIGSGSAADVLTETDRMGAMDELTAKNNAWREAWGYRVESANETARGRFAKLAAKNAMRNTLLTGGLQAATTLFSASSPGKSFGTSSGGNMRVPSFESSGFGTA
jgi:hypothetical protein